MVVQKIFSLLRVVALLLPAFVLSGPVFASTSLDNSGTASVRPVNDDSGDDECTFIDDEGNCQSDGESSDGQ